ncbi:MAG: DNA polymerase III subunit gamma/tau [Bacteroidota bacterium]|jgi:DNA polymerase-3 subunit gamma/tau|nr:DNA polymerase III subunit gamma/tau [Bacteroidota bacterium]
MDQFIVSARKYRPTTFEDVVGQRQVAETLMHEINNNKLAQAFLFTGPRGVGKTTCARILAKVINAQDGGDPNQDYAFNIFELDAASNNSVEDIRHLIDQVRIPPQVGRYKVYIIDEVHMLSTAGFNAFLKTLEEPPSYAIFILATTEKHKILPTILSRCQVFNFNRIETKDMVEHLKGIAQKENIEASEDALHLIARKADGGLRDALSMFDQLVSFGGGKITYESAVDILSVLDLDTFFDVANLLSSSNIGDALLIYDGIIKKGFDGSTFLGGLASHFRNLAVSKETKTQTLLDVSESFKSKYLEQSSALSFAFILNGLNMVSEAEEKYKQSRNPRLLVELMLMKLGHLNAFIQSIPSLEEVKKKVGQPSEAVKVAPLKRSASIVEDKPKVEAPEILPTPEVDVVRQAAQQNTIEDVKTSNATGNGDRLDGALQQANKTPALQPKDSDKVETNRLKVSSFEEFKRKKSALQTAELASELAANQANGEREDGNEQDALDSSAAESPINAGLASNSSKKTLDEFWVDFYQTQTPRVLTCLKGLKYGIEEEQLIITLNASHQDGIIEEIRPLMMQAIKKQVAHLKIQSIQTVMGKIEVQERRPYTDKEKLDYLVKKHPGLAEALESLHLRLP